MAGLGLVWWRGTQRLSFVFPEVVLLGPRLGLVSGASGGARDIKHIENSDFRPDPPEQEVFSEALVSNVVELL